MANFTLKSAPIRIKTIIGTLFSDMAKPASNYNVPFGRIGGVFVRVLLQIRLGIQKAVSVAVRVALAPIKHVYKTNEWHERKEIKRRNRWDKTDSGDTERWQ